MNPPITCFLIDDDEDDQEIFALALKKVSSSIACSFADDGTDALRKLQQDETFTPQYIFLDLNMPGMNGKQCLSELKKINRLQHTPIIIYSTSSESKDVQETQQLGASGFITKPALVSALSNQLAELILNRQDS
ncbi:response regulator [Spirosoma soli]|uniref:Response regulator n=1 Tax=Spirosoma soli TaxID=1770529 RepID=A0ABW5M2Q8_9BACT